MKNQDERIKHRCELFGDCEDFDCGYCWGHALPVENVNESTEYVENGDCLYILKGNDYMSLEQIKNEELYTKELFYWKSADGTLTPKTELTDLHVCNIVMKFGKNWLNENGHTTIVKRFEELNNKFKFFDIVDEKTK